ncbi:MAG: SMP-30/gluconolactonase/LRE family protein [Acidobacteriaceae bacterium]
MLITKFAAALLLLIGFAYAADVCHPEINAPTDAAEVKQQLAGMKSLLANATDRQTVLYIISTAQAHLGDWDAAYRSLQTATSERPWFDPSGEPAFQPVLNCPSVQTAIAKVRAGSPPVRSAQLYLTVPPADLFPEGIAVDAKTGEFYLSSTFHRKILRIGPDKAVHDFITSGDQGTLEVLGVRMDPRDHSVWANSEDEMHGKSWLHHWDHSGKLMARYTVEGGNHLFNDLVITRAGDVYLTDSAEKAFYELPNGANTLQRIALPNAYYPNGIALSDDEKYLYVSDAFDLFQIDVSTNAIRRLAPPKGASIAGFDGLYFYRGSLIGIQNGMGTPRVLQVKLSASGDSALSVRTLEYRSPMVQLPTTGAIYKGRFYFIANSQIDQEQGGKIKESAKLKPVHIAVIPIP